MCQKAKTVGCGVCFTRSQVHYATRITHRSGSCLELIEQVRVALVIISSGHGWHRLLLELLAVLDEEGVIRLECVLLNLLHQVVRHARGSKVQRAGHPEVGKGSVLRHKPVRPPGISSQGLHDKKMVQLVP